MNIEIGYGQSGSGLSNNVQAMRAMNSHNRVPEGFWIRDSKEFDDYPANDEQLVGETYRGLVSLSFIRSALKRNAKVWCAVALVGLLAGIGLYVARPAGYQATIKLLMAQPPGAAPGWISDDQQEAQTLAVAAMALKRLRMNDSPSSFANSYTVLANTGRILVLTVKAASPQAALHEANAVALAILDFQKRILTKTEKETVSHLQKLVLNAETQLADIKGNIAKANSEPSNQPQLHNLEFQYDQARAALASLKENVNSIEATTRTATTTTVHNSVVLPPAALVVQSVKRRIALYGGAGLIGGLVLGLGIVIVTAIVSTRLRRRDDVARALAAPVRLSVRKPRLSRRRLRRQGLAATQDRDLARVTMHLATAIAPASGGFASLAVVAVDDVEIPAVCLASLAFSSAREGLKVVLADLCDGAPGARLLGVDHSGVQGVKVDAVRLTVVVPDRDDVPPNGPSRVRPYDYRSEDPLLAACESADLVLTLATLDPALGGDHLAEWARSAVVVVTAGRSSVERIQSIGEMIRLAGIERISAVLVGADKSDESLGVPGPMWWRGPGPAPGSHPLRTAEPLQ